MTVRSSLRSIPNIVSLSRVVLAVAFVVDHDTNARLVIVLAAAVTDMLDGWLARRAGMVSRFGAAAGRVSSPSIGQAGDGAPDACVCRVVASAGRREADDLGCRDGLALFGCGLYVGAVEKRGSCQAVEPVRLQGEPDTCGLR